MAADVMDSGHEGGVAHAWVAHLRAGGTTGWADFTGDPVRASGRLPGAQQLEVLRRLNLLGRPPERLAAEVLAVSPPGRGSLDLPLVGLPAREYGAPPVDPAALDADDLLRVATGVLADRLVGVPLLDRSEPTARDRLRAEVAERLRRRHPFRLVGPTVRVDPLRSSLAEVGRTPGGRGAVHYVVGADMGRLVTDAWASRVVEGGAPRWSDWLETWVERDACPPRADLAAIAGTWADRRGRDRVAVVLDAAELSRELGASRPLDLPPTVPATAVELTRQVSAVLGVLVDRRRRTRLLVEALAPRLARAGDGADRALAVGEPYADWLTRRGRAQRAALLRGGYRVLGSTGLLADPQVATGTPGPDDEAVLRLALSALSGWHRQPGPPGEPDREEGA